MIQRIKHIKNLGLFLNWVTPNDLVFNKNNLFYGWNGSGKSTLSKLFRSIEQKQISLHFPNLEFQIELSDGAVIDNSFAVIPPITKVFNKDFVEENTKFETGLTESIIYIGQDNAILKAEIDANKIERKELENKITSLKEACKIKLTQKDTFFTSSGSELKAFFLNTIYAPNTYDKRIAIKIWDEIKTGASLNDFILPDAKFDNHKGFIAQGQKKEKIEFSVPKFFADNEDVLYKEVCALIAKNPVINSIDRLRKNPNIAQWVQAGLSIHKKHHSLSCEFCNQKLPDDKLNSISNHFNEEFEKLQKELADKKQAIEQLFVAELELNTSSFYADKIPHILECVQMLNDYGRIINDGLRGYLKLLSEKESEPLKTAFSTSNIGRGSIGVYNAEVDRLQAILNAHNKDVDNYDTVADNCRIEIEMHYVSKKAISDLLINLIGEIAQIEKEIRETNDTLFESEIVITQKELQLQNDSIAIEAINNNLHSFLGRDEIKLEKNLSGGYILKRNGETALNLSEGEKTAIALVYFIAKIKEKDNDLKQTIVVFDDPISSLDSNHLFNAAHFLKDEFYSDDDVTPKVLQLFVFTHNFYFFSLLKEWLNCNLNVFSVLTANENGKRKALIEKAENVLTYFNSEYHFLFAQIKDYCDSTDKTYYHTHTIANISRQVLESFLSFKYGRKKLDKCFDEITDFAEITKVRKFVNHYSHRANHGESIRGFNDNVFAETPTIVPLVLKLIEHVDVVHYNSMIKRINNN